MKDPIEVLRRKEAELERLQEEVDALRVAGRLLDPTGAGPRPKRAKIIEMPAGERA